MTTAATLASFATDTRFEHLPAPAVEHAKVVIASTIASAAMGRDIGSAKAFREIARERAGTPHATLWFDDGPRLGIEWADIAAKYRALTPMGGLSQQKIDQSLGVVQRFEEAQSVSALTDLLRV